MICPEDDSHEMPSLIHSPKKKKKQKTKKNRMSATILPSTIRVKFQNIRMNMVSADSNVYILGYISYFSLQLGLNISLKFSQKNNNKKTKQKNNNKKTVTMKCQALF